MAPSVWRPTIRPGQKQFARHAINLAFACRSHDTARSTSANRSRSKSSDGDDGDGMLHVYHVNFRGQIRMTQPQPSCDGRFRIPRTPPLAYAIVVNLKVYLRRRHMQIGARARKRVKMFLHKNRPTERFLRATRSGPSAPRNVSGHAARQSPRSSRMGTSRTPGGTYVAE